MFERKETYDVYKLVDILKYCNVINLLSLV
jgi:hypothetical protein